MILNESILHLFIQNDALPGRLHGTLVKLGALVPVASVKHPNLLVQVAGPSPSRKNQLSRQFLARREHIIVDDGWIRLAAITAVDQVDDEVVVLPLVQVLFEVSVLCNEAEASVHASGGRQIDGPRQRCRDMVVVAVVQWR